MAAKAIFIGKSLSIELPVDKDKKGKDISKKFSFKGVKKESADQDIFDLAKEIEKVLMASMSEVSLNVKSLLMNE